MGRRRSLLCGGFQLNRTKRRFDRGSPKRIRRIRWREHTPPSFVALVVFSIAVVVAVIWWLMAHPEWVEHHMR